VSRLETRDTDIGSFSSFLNHESLISSGFSWSEQLPHVLDAKIPRSLNLRRSAEVGCGNAADLRGCCRSPPLLIHGRAIQMPSRPVLRLLFPFADASLPVLSALLLYGLRTIDFVERVGVRALAPPSPRFRLQ